MICLRMRISRISLRISFNRRRDGSVTLIIRRRRLMNLGL